MVRPAGAKAVAVLRRATNATMAYMIYTCKKDGNTRVMLQKSEKRHHSCKENVKKKIQQPHGTIHPWRKVKQTQTHRKKR